MRTTHINISNNKNENKDNNHNKHNNTNNINNSHPIVIIHLLEYMPPDQASGRQHRGMQINAKYCTTN